MLMSCTLKLPVINDGTEVLSFFEKILDAFTNDTLEKKIYSKLIDDSLGQWAEKSIFLPVDAIIYVIT